MKLSLPDYLIHVSDPRIERAKKHKLIDILTISVCAVLSGAEGWEHIEMFGKIKHDWLKKFLELPNGIPSHDTIARVFSVIDPKQFHDAFTKWVSNIKIEKDGNVIAIDGKTLRRSFDKAHGKGPLHVVSAWKADIGIVIGQVKTDQKSNEITAIPDLLELLDLSGSILTIDAMGCQKSIANKIISKKADYVLALKNNHSDFLNEVQSLFKITKDRNFAGVTYDTHTTVDNNHGRLETRVCYCLSAKEWFPDLKEWKGLKTVVMIESTREQGETKNSQTRFYISSLPGNAEQTMKVVRSHWGIENSLHWVLDMTFREDESRIRKDNSPENLAIIRKVVMNLIKLKKDKKLSFKKAKLAATWDLDYALNMVFGD